MTGNTQLTSKIKRVMLKDKEVGRISAATPIVIEKALELFVQRLLTEAIAFARMGNAKKIMPSHIKAAVHADAIMDFLKEIVEHAPDVSAESEERKPARPAPAIPVEISAPKLAPKRKTKRMAGANKPKALEKKRDADATSLEATGLGDGNSSEVVPSSKERRLSPCAPAEPPACETPFADQVKDCGDPAIFPRPCPLVDLTQVLHEYWRPEDDDYDLDEDD